MPRSFNLADLFEIVVDAAPDRTALIAGDVRLTYRELDERANRVAHHLRSEGVRPGDRVAIIAYNRAEWLETQIGVYKLRAVPVNVNYRYTAGELAYVVNDSEATAMVGERSLLVRIDDVPLVKHVMVIEDHTTEELTGAVSYEEALAAADPGRDFGERSGDDLYLLYTGGTTGMPKGVMWRSEDIFFSAMFGGRLMADPVTKPEELADSAVAGGLTVMVCAPLMHGAGMWVAWLALLSGGTLVLWSERSFATDRVLDLAVKEKAQVMLLVGDVMARPIVELLEQTGRELPDLIAIGTGGSATSPGVKKRLHTALPSLMAILDAFGGSETGASGQAVEPAADGSPRFSPRFDVAVLDDELRPIPAGSDQIGVMARSGRIPLGYWNDEAKTAETFVTDAGGTRWALQGDFAKVDTDGSIILLGRGSTVVNTGGEKVYPEEVEATLKTHPAVYDVLVVGVPDERLGQRVTAVISVSSEVSAEELTAHCRATIAGYKVPRDYRFVDEVRRTPSGKADLRWARTVATEPH
jgi:3-oxocholest-4-en-26-oate---CoA ligase